MQVEVDRDRLRELCQLYHIRKLSFFGSVLSDALRPDSDIDILVDFEPEHVPGFLKLHTISEEFSKLFGGRVIDLVTEKFLNARIRQRVLQQAQIAYVR